MLERESGRGRGSKCHSARANGPLIVNFDRGFCTGGNHYYLAESKIVIMDSPGFALVAILYIIIILNGSAIDPQPLLLS